MSTQTALIIDDEPDIRELVSITVSRLGLECLTAANLSDARNVLANYPVNVCLTDMRLPDGNGVDFIDYMQKAYPDIPVAVITAHGNMDAAVTAMKKGAFDFVSKPVDIKLLRKLIEAAAKSTRIDTSATEPARLTTGETKKTSNEIDAQLLGNSQSMRRLKSMIRKLAKSMAPVLINGESGTGKELVAKLIHQSGPGAEKPFIPINCGAIPTELMESEFFGHKKGSFTGATEDKLGLFQAAEDGTLFLDEVAELPLFMQVKLLRVIQEKAVKPVGENREIPINVRIISASYKDLELEVEHSRFRHDLLYRLNVIGVTVPALRHRSGDIALLANCILKKLAHACSDEKPYPLSDEALKALEKYHFPGNVRELENILERAITLADGDTLQQADLFLPEQNRSESVATPSNLDQDSNLKEFETQLILEALDKTHWNRKEAASILGISYRQLRYRLQKMNINT